MCKRVVCGNLRVKELCVKGCAWKSCVWKFVCSSLLRVMRVCVKALCVCVYHLYRCLFIAGGRWGTLQSAANEDAAMFLCKRACIIYTYIVPPLGAYVGGTYILSLLVFMVNVYCDYTSLYYYI